MIRELTCYSIAAALPAASCAWGLQAHHVASAGYVQTEAGLGYAKKLGQADIGLVFNYHSVGLAGYGKSNMLVAGIGAAWHVAERVHTGLSVYMPAGRRQPPTIKPGYACRGGIGYEISPQVLLAGEIMKEEDRPPDVRAGFTYRPVTTCTLMAGIHTGAAQPYAGIALQWQTLRIQLVMKYHAALGLTSALGFSYVSASKPAANEVK